MVWNATDDSGTTWYDKDLYRVVDFVTESNRRRAEHSAGLAPVDSPVLVDEQCFQPNKVWRGKPDEGSLPVPG